MAYGRSPIGSFQGCLAKLSAIELLSQVISGTFSRYDALAPFKSQVEELFVGNVLSANLGQSPANQVALAAGLGNNVNCTAVSKVCASGMKAICLAAQQIALGQADFVIAGGMESMSNAPHYLAVPRSSSKLVGSIATGDAIMRDGLLDAASGQSMGQLADSLSQELAITREQQDAYAVASYEKAIASQRAGHFSSEIIPIAVGTDVVHCDEEPKNVPPSRQANQGRSLHRQRCLS